jgi:penicillin-binding protein 2
VPIPIERAPDLGLKPETLAVIRAGMKGVVAAGTGWRARLDGVSVSGKTGSAQVVGKARLERNPSLTAILPHGWFVAFAPTEAPRIALAVLVEHGGSGSEGAAPLAREILASYFGLATPKVAPAGGPAEVEAGDP